MPKYLMIIVLIILNFRGSCQIFELDDKVENIPTFQNNKQFLKSIHTKYLRLIRDKADSVLLYYPIAYNTNFAVLIWKRNGGSFSMGFSQRQPPNQKIKREVLNSAALNGVNIKMIFDLLQDSGARRLDTNIFISHNNPIYLKFHFGNIDLLTACYSAWENGRFGREFVDAFWQEEYRMSSRLE